MKTYEVQCIDYNGTVLERLDRKGQKKPVLKSIRKRNPSTYEVIDPHDKVEREGYVKPSMMVQKMLRDGETLIAWRTANLQKMIDRGAFDFDKRDQKGKLLVDDNYVDPTRDPSFDLSDATQMEHALDQKKKAYAKQEARLKREAKELLDLEDELNKTQAEIQATTTE